MMTAGMVQGRQMQMPQQMSQQMSQQLAPQSPQTQILSPQHPGSVPENITSPQSGPGRGTPTLNSPVNPQVS